MMHVAIDSTYAGMVAVQGRLKTDTHAVIDALDDAGLRIVMATYLLRGCVQLLSSDPTLHPAYENSLLQAHRYAAQSRIKLPRCHHPRRLYDVEVFCHTACRAQRLPPAMTPHVSKDVPSGFL